MPLEKGGSAVESFQLLQRDCRCRGGGVGRGRFFRFQGNRKDEEKGEKAFRFPEDL
jgi:hypothetical protein